MDSKAQISMIVPGILPTDFDFLDISKILSFRNLRTSTTTMSDRVFSDMSANGIPIGCGQVMELKGLLSQRLPRTSVHLWLQLCASNPSAPARRDLAVIGLPPTELSSQASCAREETSPVETGTGERVSTEKSAQPH
jgi:hypothetical protein